MKLDGKVALITGGTSGIGLATARLFCEEGVRVVVAGMNQNSLNQIRRYLGAGVTAFTQTFANSGTSKILFKQFGISTAWSMVCLRTLEKGTAAPLEAVTEEQANEQFSVNFKEIFFTIQKAAPILAGRGSIVLTTSFLNAVGTPGLSVLSATKAAARTHAALPRNSPRANPGERGEPAADQYI